MHRCLAALVIWSLAFAATPAEPDIGAWIERQRAEWGVPGVTVALVQAGQAARIYASGVCDLETKRACTPDSEFHIGSNTKFFTGVLAAALVAEEAVSLDEPIVDAWPEFRLSDERWTKVTLRDLLSQRSGLGSVEWPYYWDLSFTRKDYLARLPHVPMQTDFRARWRYSNANFVAAGTYLERKTGASWEELMRRKLLGPLGMKRSGFGVPRATRGYWFDRAGGARAVAPALVKANGPAGTLVSTAGDYARFLEMVANEGNSAGKTIVPPIAIRIATAPTVGTGYDRRFYTGPGGYAFGIFTAGYRGQRILHHGGGYAGYSSHVAILPDAKLAVAVLCNRNVTVFPEGLALGLVDLVQSRPADEGMRAWKEAEEPPPVAPKAEQPVAPTRAWSEYAGRYLHPAWGSFEITAEGKGLRIRFATLDVPLDHYSYDSFSFESAPGWERLRLRFESGFEGRIDGFTLDDAVNPQPMRFSKVD